MLFHVSFRVEHTRLDRDEFWDEWERETQAALGALEAGVISGPGVRGLRRGRTHALAVLASGAPACRVPASVPSAGVPSEERLGTHAHGYGRDRAC